MQWKEKIISIAKMNQLFKYIYKKAQAMKLVFVDEYADDADKDKHTDAQLIAQNEQEQGDASMQLAITCNCKATPAQLVQSKKSAFDMWKTLCTQYEGSGTVLEYNAIQEYMRLAYDDYPSLEQFIIAFQQSIEKLTALNVALPEKWYPMNFIVALAPRQPVQAERQRSNARSKDKLSLTALIEDITDEARTKENSKASGSSALYSNKPDKKNKSKAKDKNKEKGSTDKDNDKDHKTCPYCKNPNPCHKPDDCLEGNDKKRKE